MKSARITALLMAGIMSLGALASCSAEPESGHKLYLRDDFGSEKVETRFFNTAGEETETKEMKLEESGDDYSTFSVSADPEKYNRVAFITDDDEKIEAAFNEYVSGYHASGYGLVPFTYDEKEENQEYDTVALPYEDDEKNIYIWTPDDYDAKSKDKYSVIYMTDGQNLFSAMAQPSTCWYAAESVRAMMSLSKNKAIIVGIDDGSSNRDSELTPDIGVSTQDSYNNGTGKYFAKFVAKKVVPYIEKNYNVYTDREHNSVCGSSSGGIESFFIGMEYPEKFGTIGALSPAFGLFDNDTWKAYLKTKKFGKDSPFVYIYCGEADDLESFLLPGAKDMQDNLVSCGYDKDKITVELYDKGAHNESYWRVIFPQFLAYAFN